MDFPLLSRIFSKFYWKNACPYGIMCGYRFHMEETQAEDGRKRDRDG